MIRSLLALAALLLAIDASAVTYYTLVRGVAAPRSADYQPPCQSGRCANYGTENVVTGWFGTTEPLPPNLAGVDIYPRLVAYAFTDGLTLHASANPDSRVQSFVVTTSGTGSISVDRLWLVTWASGARPHSPGDRLNSLVLAGGSATAANNDFCIGISQQSGFGVETGIDDACPFVKPDVSSSAASTSACATAGASVCSPGPAAWLQQAAIVVPALPVPALSASSLWALEVLVILAALLAARAAIPGGSRPRAAPSTTSPSPPAGTARTPRATS